jgi:hypothetical protein
MRKTEPAIRFRKVQAMNINLLGPKLFTKGAVTATSNMEIGIEEIRRPIQEAGMSILRPKSTSIGPTRHCQESTLKTTKSKNFRGASPSSRILASIGSRNNMEPIRENDPALMVDFLAGCVGRLKPDFAESPQASPSLNP